jgi:hypothetical protein
MGDNVSDTKIVNTLSNAGPGWVTVPLDRLKELEELERRLPSLIEQVIADYKMSRLKALRERDKADANLVRQRARRYAEKHRDSINERRRLKRIEGATANLLVVEPPQENLETDRPGADHGKPEKGNVIPAPSCPILFEGACQEHANPSQPKRKGRPQKILNK